MKYSHSIYYILLFLQTKMKYFFKIVLNKLPSAFIIMEELLRLRNCQEIAHDNYLSKCPSAALENLDIARYACDFLLCS